MAIPETAPFILIPASISANEPAQTVAIEDEPLDSKISDTTRMVYGFSKPSGNIRFKPRKAKLPCPISLRPGPRLGFTSPVENEGKL